MRQWIFDCFSDKSGTFANKFECRRSGFDYIRLTSGCRLTCFFVSGSGIQFDKFRNTPWANRTANTMWMKARSGELFPPPVSVRRLVDAVGYCVFRHVWRTKIVQVSVSWGQAKLYNQCRYILQRDLCIRMRGLAVRGFGRSFNKNQLYRRTTVTRQPAEQMVCATDEAHICYSLLQIRIRSGHVTSHRFKSVSTANMQAKDVLWQWTLLSCSKRGCWIPSRHQCQLT